MVNMDEQDRMSRLVSERARNPRMPAPDDVTPDEWAQVVRLAAVEAALFDHAHGAPALEHDPVAAMLGLVPDPNLSLAGSALKRARTRAGLKVSEVARALTEEGWDITTAEVARWESHTGTVLAPVLLQSVAASVSSSVESITTKAIVATKSAGAVGGSASERAIDAVMATSAFQELTRRFARVQGLSRTVAASTLRSRALATVHRGDEPDAAQWLKTLDAFVTALESREHPKPTDHKRPT
jgi:hypothetical protein